MLKVFSKRLIAFLLVFALAFSFVFLFDTLVFFENKPAKADTIQTFAEDVSIPAASDIVFSNSNVLSFSNFCFSSVVSSSTYSTTIGTFSLNNPVNLQSSFSLVDLGGLSFRYNYTSAWNYFSSSSLYTGGFTRTSLVPSYLPAFVSSYFGSYFVNQETVVPFYLARDGFDVSYGTSSYPNSFGLAVGVPSLICLPFHSVSTVTATNTSYYAFRFIVYSPKTFISTDVAYLKTEYVPRSLKSVLGVTFLPDNFYDLSGVPAVSSSGFSLYSYTFYDFNNDPVLYLMFPCYFYYLRRVNDTSSSGTDFITITQSSAPVGIVRYAVPGSDGSVTFSQAYSQGYDAGLAQGNSDGYNKGYSDGNTFGYNNGYGVGYKEGANAAHEYTFFNLISSVLSAPIGAITGLLNFNVLGVDMSAFFFSLLTLCIIVKIVMVVA